MVAIKEILVYSISVFMVVTIFGIVTKFYLEL